MKEPRNYETSTCSLGAKLSQVKENAFRAWTLEPDSPGQSPGSAT